MCVCVCGCVLYTLNLENMCKRLGPVRVRRSKYPLLLFKVDVEMPLLTGVLLAFGVDCLSCVQNCCPAFDL